ncbi:TIGR02391 family protein, partial [Nocardia thailandica]
TTHPAPTAATTRPPQPNIMPYNRSRRETRSKSMNDGLRQFAPGAQMTIRNSAAHSTEKMSEQDALERLGALSLLARWVDTCDRVEAPQIETDQT